MQTDPEIVHGHGMPGECGPLQPLIGAVGIGRRTQPVTVTMEEPILGVSVSLLGLLQVLGKPRSVRCPLLAPL